MEFVRKSYGFLKIRAQTSRLVRRECPTFVPQSQSHRPLGPKFGSNDARRLGTRCVRGSALRSRMPSVLRRNAPHSRPILALYKGCKGFGFWLLTPKFLSLFSYFYPLETTPTSRFCMQVLTKVRSPEIPKKFTTFRSKCCSS